MTERGRSYQASEIGVCCCGASIRVEREKKTDRTDIELDAELLRRAAERWPGEGAESDVDPMELAAYLDRRLDAEAAEAMEGTLAADPAALELWLAADAAQGARYPVPPSMMRRVAGRRLRPESKGWIRRLGHALAPDRPRGVAWAVAGALLLAICAGGFQLGRYGYEASRGPTQTAQIDGPFFGPRPIF